MDQGDDSIVGTEVTQSRRTELLADKIRFAGLQGNVLTLSSPPTPMGGKDVVAELVWARPD